jgi:hypothetical protein
MKQDIIFAADILTHERTHARTNMHISSFSNFIIFTGRTSKCLVTRPLYWAIYFRIKSSVFNLATFSDKRHNK